MRRRTGATLAIVLVTALFLVPSTGAILPSGSTVNAPYKGTAVYTAGSATTSRCPADANLHSAGPSWSAKYGRISVADTAVAKWCGSGVAPATWGNSTADWFGTWYLLVPIQLLAGPAQQTVNASWQFAWTHASTYRIVHSCRGTPMPGASTAYLQCTAGASVSFYEVNYLYDATAGSYYFPSGAFPTVYNYSYTEHSTSCAPACHRSAISTPSSGPANVTANYTFRFALTSPNASHVWYLFVYGLAHVHASISTLYQNFGSVVPMSGTVEAMLNMAGPGRGANLTSITVA